jgi:futalosine hydrolase
MILALAATEFEMSPLLQRLTAHQQKSSGERPASCWRTLVSGVGPVETTLRLTRYLDQCDVPIDCVINFGVAGAYVPDMPDTGGHAGLLDLCLAEEEGFGDFGICFADRVEAFDVSLGGAVVFPLDQGMLARAGEILSRHGLAYLRGNFVTVTGASATRQRGAMLAARCNGLCENMEGAAVARVCAEFSLPLLELRAISNLVLDRDLSRWQLAAACGRAAEAAALLMAELETSS